MDENHPIYRAIDRGGGQTCDVPGVVRELERAGFTIVPKGPAGNPYQVALTAFASVVMDAERVHAEERNDVQDRRAVNRFADRYRMGSKDKQDGWAVRKFLAAIFGSIETLRVIPCPVCGGEASHAVDLLRRTVIKPAVPA